jgi:hypothetical protein
MSAKPFAVGTRLAVPSAYIAPEPGWVGAPLVGALAEGRHEACPYLVIELRKWEAASRRSADPAPAGSAPEWRLRFCDAEVATANSSWGD